MVSLKKIGAIATGALFVGATVGMAGAVTVPADFKASMLADKGVAKAQLVVGKNAPGKVEDTASAEVIQEAVKTKLAVTGVGGDIKIEWQTEELDGNPETDDDADIPISKGDKGTYYFKNTSLLFDSDGDGKPSDDDYKLYDGISWDSYGRSVDITPVLNATLPSGSTDYGYLDEKIRGHKYFVTRIDASDKIITIGIPQSQRLPAGKDEKSTWNIEGTDIVVEEVDSNAGRITLWIAGHGEEIITFNTSASDYPYFNTSKWIKDNFDGTVVFKPIENTNSTEVIYVSPDARVDLKDGREALGYAKVSIPTVARGATIEFKGPLQTLERDDIQQLEGTFYEVEYAYDKNQVRVRVKAETTVASESKLDPDDDPYDEFLNNQTGYVMLTAISQDTIEIEWQTEELDGNPETDDDADIPISKGDKGTYYFKNTLLLFDSDGDGKPSDDDYKLYDGISWDSYGRSVDITPVLNATLPSGSTDYGYLDEKIRGHKYFVTRIDASDKIITIGIPQSQRLPAGKDEKSTWNIEGTDIVVEEVDSNAGRITLWIAGHGEEIITFNTSASDYPYFNTSKWIKDNFDGTVVFKPIENTNSTEVIYVSPDARVDLKDGREALGYAKVSIPTVARGATIEFKGPLQTLERDDIQQLEGTFYEVEYAYDKNQVRVRVKAETTVASESKLDPDDDPYDEFLNKQTGYVMLTVTEGEELVPELEIVDEDTAASDMNLVLIGGPVANSLVADLVTAGKSKVDWYTSEGDIEVISDHPASGLTSIIVAGKDREATRAAAEALAAAL